MAKKENPYATPSLVLGLLSVFFAFVFVVPIASLVVGILGVVKAGELKAEGIKKTGKGLSVTGIVLGAVYLLVAFYQLKFM